VPRISAFYGIVIAMYFRDHQPPHFHAIYGEHTARVAIEGADVISGYLPPRALRLVRKWAELRREELERNWVNAAAHRPLDTIEPLP
jgi:Domain of unknown function (DUF4160)